jgi:hypothetical protein
MSRRRALRWGAEPPSRAEAERMLEPATRFVLEARERNAGLAALDLEGALERLEHEWAPHQALRIHSNLTRWIPRRRRSSWLRGWATMHDASWGSLLRSPSSG